MEQCGNKRAAKKSLGKITITAETVTENTCEVSLDLEAKVNPIKTLFSCCREKVQPNLLIERAKETPDLQYINLT